ncbi:unnamed protein product [Pylaiella littoralis]
MCLHTCKDNFGAGSSLSPSRLVARKSPPAWTSMLWSPLEFLLVCTTMTLGFGCCFCRTFTGVDLPSPGSVAAVFHGMLVLLHGLVEGPRLQVLPVYVPTVLLSVVATTGGFGGSVALLVAVGALILGLVSLSLLLCQQMPRLLPVGGRGPYAVGIATEHIRTPVAALGDGAKATASEEELWPLELMVQVFYPVEKSCVAKLPWFPSSIRRFRRSLAPATGEAQRAPFGLTQMGVVGASVVLGLEATLLAGSPPSLRDLLQSSFSSLVASVHAWTVAAAVAACLACLVSDVRMGSSRTAYKPRYLAREQARRIATFAKMPGWLTAHVCGFHGPGFEAGHFYGPDVPCFPAAPVGPGERKRPMVIFSHGLGGNRAVYAEHGAAYAAQGYVAVFLEHNDGSGSSAMFPDGRLTGYAAAPSTRDVSAPENHPFRQVLLPFSRRGREVRLVRAHLAKLARGSATDLEACRGVGLGDVIDTKRPALVGHSFGGGTVLQVLSDERERASSGGAGDMDPEETGYSMAFVMDAWTHPCGDEAKAQSLDVPVVFITTDGFLGDEGTRNEERLVDNAVRVVREGANDLAIQLRVKNAAHNNFSDSALFAPGIMRRLKSAGKMDGVTFIDQVTRLTLCALEVFLRRRTDSGDAVKTPAPADLAKVFLGSDLSVAFPEARVKRACARGVLPPTEVASG